MLSIFIIFLLFTLSCVSSIELKNFDEGSCRPVKTVKDLDIAWIMGVDKWYLGGGSKYNLYRLAANYSGFSNMTEYEFNNNACYYGEWNLAAMEGQLYGFGNKLVGDWVVELTEDPFSFDFVPKSKPEDALRHQVTFTDNKSFLFFNNCWLSDNKPSFGIGFTTLDEEAKIMIEKHAISMGFDKKHFTFLRYDNCSIPMSTNEASHE